MKICEDDKQKEREGNFDEIKKYWKKFVSVSNQSQLPNWTNFLPGSELDKLTFDNIFMPFVENENFNIILLKSCQDCSISIKILQMSKAF